MNPVVGLLRQDSNPESPSFGVLDAWGIPGGNGVASANVMTELMKRAKEKNNDNNGDTDLMERGD